MPADGDWATPLPFWRALSVVGEADEAGVGTEDFGGASRERGEAVAVAAAGRLGTALVRREVFVVALLVEVEVKVVG